MVTLVTGTSLAQALPVLVSPILTRIYSPDDFGILALFMSVSVILGIVANLKYELAVLLPEKDSDAVNIVSLGLVISFFLSAFLLIILFLFHDSVVVIIGDERLAGWIYLVPPVVFLVGMYGMLNYYNTRVKKYKAIAFSRVVKSVAMVSVQLVAGFGKMAFGGLILGYAISHLFGNFKLFKNFVQDENLRTEISKSGMRRMARRYKRFPIFTFPATLANKMATDLTNILISLIFNVTTLGFYSLGMRMLGFPSSLIGTSIGQLYMQEASNEKERSGKATITFNSVLKKLILVGLPVFTIIFLFAEPIFAFVFGEEWRVAGTYARYLIPLLFIRFVVSPVSVSLSIFEKQHRSLFLQVGMLIVTLLVFGYAWQYKVAFETFLLIYVIVLSVYYLFFLLILFNTVKGKTS
ncbi:MAG: oligosaccharide flippase family protein [Bacteroidetes bacterium]|nr:oligosaccharide flippase family protein [Bacteroidota bacterium]